jgi:methionyl-tRNA formyltransferase
MNRLRLAFLGTPDFALPCLEALAAAGHEIACVYCQPPRPAGRGNKPRPSPVQALAEARGWPLRTPTSLKDPDEQQAVAALGLDAGVVVAYGLLLPGPILAAPRLGCLNLHASLLPRWRGAAPIQRAVLAGDQETGVTIMLLDEGLDTGPVLLQQAVPIGPATTAAELHDRLAELGAGMMVEALDGLDRGTLTPRPQPPEGATYAAKLERAESRLDWRRPAAELERRVRAFDPWPGAYAELPGRKGLERVGVLACEVLDRDPGAEAGSVLDERLTIACGEGALRLSRVRRAGRAAVDVPAFLRGFPVPPGTRLPLSDDDP